MSSAACGGRRPEHVGLSDGLGGEHKPDRAHESVRKQLVVAHARIDNSVANGRDEYRRAKQWTGLRAPAVRVHDAQRNFAAASATGLSLRAAGDLAEPPRAKAHGACLPKFRYANARYEVQPCNPSPSPGQSIPQLDCE
jgi:hypothetical protein